MAHILMAGVGAHGHTNPHLGVVAELVERGHRVDWIIPAGFAEIVAATGARPLVVSSVTPDETAGEQWPVDPVAGTALFLDELEHVFPQVEHLRPDLVLADIGGYAGRALAEIHAIPFVQLSSAMVAWEGFAEDLGEALAFRDTPEFQAYDARFAAWLAARGIALSPDDFTGRPPRCLVLIPRAMQPFADKVDPARYTFVGPSLDRRTGSWPASGAPLVLVSLGSNYTDHPEFYRACAEAFAPLGWRVVIAHGNYVTPADIGPVSAELHRWVPQFAVLGRASLFVTHAGMGGCAEGLYQGVPMITVPQAVDQFGNAATLTELGVGVQVATEATVDELRAALARVDTDAVRARSAELAAQTRAEGGARAAADYVESVLA